MTTDTRLSADEILDELCAYNDGDIGVLPTVENHCEKCKASCKAVENKCRNCGSVGTLFVSWEDTPFFVRECRVCGDCC